MIWYENISRSVPIPRGGAGHSKSELITPIDMLE